MGTHLLHDQSYHMDANRTRLNWHAACQGKNSQKGKWSEIRGE